MQMVVHRRQVPFYCQYACLWLTSKNLDLHLAVVGGNACVAHDRTDDSVFTTRCFNAADIGGGDHGGGNPVVETFNIVETSIPPPPTTEGRQIKWLEDGVERCLQVNNGAFGNGQSIGM
jgi:hypothetical protein